MGDEDDEGDVSDDYLEGLWKVHKRIMEVRMELNFTIVSAGVSIL